MKTNLPLISRMIIMLSVAVVSSPCLAQVLGSQLSHGERIAIEDREFSIQPPWGWETFRDFNGAMLYFQAPKENGVIYQRNIRIMAFAGPKYIDDMTFQAFGKEIVDNSSKMSNAVADYRLRNQMPIEIAGGRKAGLYYAEFSIQDVALMQMHILVSSANFHFLMTYTDITENFEKNDSAQLNEAFASLQSVELAGLPPSRSSYFYWLVFGLGGLFTGLIIIKIFMALRVKSLGKGLDEFSDEESEATADDDIKVDESHLSDLGTKSRKKTQEKTAGFFKKKAKPALDEDAEFAADDEEAISDIKPQAKKKRARRSGKNQAEDSDDLEETAELPAADSDDDDGWKF